MITHRLEALEARLLFQAATAPSDVEIRVNQVGYLRDETKVALILSKDDLAGQTVAFVDADGNRRFASKVGRDRGAYASYAHLYEADFTQLHAAGRYRIKLAKEQSVAFSINDDVYRSLIPTTLSFYRVQRSGNTRPLNHAPSHLTDGTASGGSMSGKHVDVAGGWYDAGDYLKFILPSGFAAALMLSAFEQNPDAFIDADQKDAPQVLVETKVELDWYTKMWDAKNQVLYYQVGDSKDHDDYGWRLPDNDDKLHPNRPVFASENGKGANLAGKMAASLALGAKLWGDASKPWHDEALAAKYRAAAAQLYAWGKQHTGIQNATNDFYSEESWKDDMSLAGAELYRLTRNKTYLHEAEGWANEIGSQGAVDYGDLNALSVFELARLDPSFKANAAAALRSDLTEFSKASEANPWGVALQKLDWGSGAQMNGAALEAMWYQSLTGDTKFATMALRQRDYLLGNNPWGVCMVNGAGTVWPHHPHHQIADIKKIELTGFWAEGPVPKKTFTDQKIKLRAADAYAPFQTAQAVYHDDAEDYTTNEPTLDMNATGLALTSWFAKNNPPATRPSK